MIFYRWILLTLYFKAGCLSCNFGDKDSYHQSRYNSHHIYSYIFVYCENIYIYIYIYIYQPFHTSRMWHKVNFSSNFTGLKIENSWFEFIVLLFLDYTMVKKLSLPYYLLIVGGRIVGCIPFLSLIVLCEMQMAKSRIWTRVNVLISYNNDNYITSASIYIYIYIYVCVCMCLCVIGQQSFI